MFALSLSYSLPVLTLAYFIFAVLSAEPTARGAFISAENETGWAVGEAQTPDEECMMFPFCRRDFEQLRSSSAVQDVWDLKVHQNLFCSHSDFTIQSSNSFESTENDTRNSKIRLCPSLFTVHVCVVFIFFLNWKKAHISQNLLYFSIIYVSSLSVRSLENEKSSSFSESVC